MYFFFSSRRRHTRYWRDWSSDVCSSDLAKEAIEILEENFGDRVFASRIRKTIRFAEAPVKGMSVLKYDPDGVAAHSYRQLAKEVLGDGRRSAGCSRDRKSTRLNSSHANISYAVFCLK